MANNISTHKIPQKVGITSLPINESELQTIFTELKNNFHWMKESDHLLPINESCSRKFLKFTHDPKYFEQSMVYFFENNLKKRVMRDKIEIKSLEEQFEVCVRDFYASDACGFRHVLTNLKIMKIALEIIDEKKLQTKLRTLQEGIELIQSNEFDRFFELLGLLAPEKKKGFSFSLNSPKRGVVWPYHLFVKDEMLKGFLQQSADKIKLKEYFHKAVKNLQKNDIPLTIEWKHSYTQKGPFIPDSKPTGLLRNLDFHTQTHTTLIGPVVKNTIDVRKGNFVFVQDEQLFLENRPRTVKEYIEQVLQAFGASEKETTIDSFLTLDERHSYTDFSKSLIISFWKSNRDFSYYDGVFKSQSFRDWFQKKYKKPLSLQTNLNGFLSNCAQAVHAKNATILDEFLKENIPIAKELLLLIDPETQFQQLLVDHPSLQKLYFISFKSVEAAETLLMKGFNSSDFMCKQITESPRMMQFDGKGSVSLMMQYVLVTKNPSFVPPSSHDPQSQFIEVKKEPPRAMSSKDIRSRYTGLQGQDVPPSFPRIDSSNQLTPELKRKSKSFNYPPKSDLKTSSSSDQLSKLSQVTPISRMAEPNEWSHDGEYAKFWLIQSFDTKDLSNGVKSEVALQNFEFHPFVKPEVAKNIAEKRVNLLKTIELNLK